MNCKKCDSPVEQNEMFCANCGEKNPDFKEDGTSAFSSYDNGGKKKKGVAKIAIGVAAALAVAGVAFAGINVVSGIFISPKDQFKKAVRSDIDSSVSFLGNVIDTTKEKYKLYKEGIGTTGRVSLEVSPEGKSALESEFPYYMSEISWLDNFTINYQGNMSESAVNFDLNTLINDKEFMDANLYLDNKELQVKLPDLSDDVITADAGSLSSEFGYGSSVSLFDVMGKNIALMNATPDSKRINKITAKYTDIILKGIKDVERTSDSVSVEGINVKATKLTANISGEEARDLKIEVLNQLIADEDIKEILTGYQEVYENMPGKALKYGDSDIYGEFIDEIKSELEFVEYDTLHDIKYSVWIGSGKKVMARELLVDDKKVMLLKTPRKGSDIGVEFTAMEDSSDIKFSGKGKINGSNIEGDFVLEAGGKTVYIKSNKFDLKKLEEDKTDIEVELSTSADEEYGDYSLFVKLSGDSKKKTITVDLKKKGQSLVKIESYEELAKMTGIDELDGKKLSSDSYADIMAYMAGIKSDKFIEKLRKTDIPKEYVDILESQLP